MGTAPVPPGSSRKAKEPAPTKECRHCGSIIPIKAKFCAECELFQRRFFTAKSSVGYFTLINALVATTLVATTFTMEKLPEWGVIDNPKPLASAPLCYRDRIQLGIDNGGKQSVAIEGISVSAEGLSDTLALEIDGPAIIAKGEYRNVSATFIDPKEKVSLPFNSPEEGDSQKQCTYSFKFQYRDQDGIPQNLPVPDCDCATQTYHEARIGSSADAKPGSN